MATRLAAFEIKSKSWHANKVVCICGDAFLRLQRRTVFDGSELVICSCERSRSPPPEDQIQLHYSCLGGHHTAEEQMWEEEQRFLTVTRTLSDPATTNGGLHSNKVPD